MSQLGVYLSEERIEVKIEGYTLVVRMKLNTLVVDKIKRKGQRKFRYLEEYYNEVNNIKVNYYDDILRRFSRAPNSLEEAIEDNKNLVYKLGLDLIEIEEAYKNEVRNHMNNELETLLEGLGG